MEGEPTTAKEIIVLMLDAVYERIDSNNALVNQKLDTIIEYNKIQNGAITRNMKRIEESDKRIDKLENWRWYILGVIVGFLFVFEMVIRIT